MRKQEAPGSIQTNWLLANQVICLRKQGAQGLAVLSKAWNIRLGTRQVFRRFQSQNVCLEDTKASVVKEKRLQTNQRLRTGESRKGSWRQNALECVPIPEDWAWAGRRAGAQRKAGQGESNLESLTSPRTTHTSLLFLISQPCWVCILICPRIGWVIFAENLWEVVEWIYQTPLSKPGSLDPGFLLSLSPSCSEQGWYVHHQQQEQGKGS